jgi:CRISPR/Cas system-associated exonuclease Cas4 (RecB family)
MPDKFKAVWVSHSSMADFLKCPRLYYLRNVYKDPQTRHKMTLMSPALALGQTVHEVVESLSVLPTQTRFASPLRDKYELSWKKVAGKKGGFSNEIQEKEHYQKGLEMLKRIEENPGPLSNLAVKIQKDLPYYWISPEEEIILCGKIDWLEYFPDTDAVHIIDFKTGKSKEQKDSMQLPIYLLLATNCQKRPVIKASYWYLLSDAEPEEMELPDLDEAHDLVLKIAKEVRLARKLERMKCPTNGCRYCEPYEKILSGNATFVGLNDFGQDIYILPDNVSGEEESVIL